MNTITVDLAISPPNGRAIVKTLILSTIAAAAIALSAGSAFAGPTTDGNDPDFYAIQRGLPYAGAQGLVMPGRQTAMPKNPVAHRVFLRGRQFLSSGPAYDTAGDEQGVFTGYGAGPGSPGHRDSSH